MEFVKVDAKELASIATRIQGNIVAINDAYKNIDMIVGRSQRYWQGEASNKHVSKNDSIKADYFDVYKRLVEEPSKLYKIAGVYEKTEVATTEITMSLPTEVLL